MWYAATVFINNPFCNVACNEVGGGWRSLILSPNAGSHSGGLWRFVICYDVAVSMRWRSANRLLLSSTR